jgi:hypothetical protein
MQLCNFFAQDTAAANVQLTMQYPHRRFAASATTISSIMHFIAEALCIETGIRFK